MARVSEPIAPSMALRSALLTRTFLKARRRRRRTGCAGLGVDERAGRGLVGDDDDRRGRSAADCRRARRELLRPAAAPRPRARRSPSRSAGTCRRGTSPACRRARRRARRVANSRAGEAAKTRRRARATITSGETAAFDDVIMLLSIAALDRDGLVGGEPVELRREAPIDATSPLPIRALARRAFPSEAGERPRSHAGRGGRRFSDVSRRTCRS